MKLYNTTPRHNGIKPGIEWWGFYTDANTKLQSPTKTLTTPYLCTLPKSFKEELIVKGIDIENTDFDIQIEEISKPNSTKFFRITDIVPNVRTRNELPMQQPTVPKVYDVCIDTCIALLCTIVVGDIVYERTVSSQAELEDFVTSIIVDLNTATTIANVASIVDTIERWEERMLTRLTVETFTDSMDDMVDEQTTEPRYEKI